MTLTPVEIRHLKPAKSIVGGYQRTAVDGLLDEIVASFEDVWRERADLADKVEQLESDLVRYRELETLLRTTLVSAEKAAVTLKEQAGTVRRGRSGPPLPRRAGARTRRSCDCSRRHSRCRARRSRSFRVTVRGTRSSS